VTTVRQPPISLNARELAHESRPKKLVPHPFTSMRLAISIWWFRPQGVIPMGRY